ncbi:MAG: hypothetical protein QW356_04865 [Candidatus Hadarchaeales archaeon]
MKAEAVGMAFLILIFSTATVSPGTTASATLAATLQTVINIGLDNTALNWGTITKPSSYTWVSYNHLPAGNANCIKLIIYSDTNVRVDIQYYGTKLTRAGAPGGDYEMEVRICNTTAGNSPVEQYGSYTAVPWLADLGPPAGSNLENDNIHPQLGVAANQYGGSYTGGALNFQAVEG